MAGEGGGGGNQPLVPIPFSLAARPTLLPRASAAHSYIARGRMRALLMDGHLWLVVMLFLAMFSVSEAWIALIGGETYCWRGMSTTVVAAGIAGSRAG